jgi:hypothetical protein
MLLTCGLAAILGGALTGCTTSGVGDPCVVETEPRGGFGRDEVLLEVNSVQCRTRVCIAYGFRGNPRHIIGEPSCPCEDGSPSGTNDAGRATCELAFDDCVTRLELEARMLCSCRCGLLPGSTSSSPLCECPSGFVCEGETAFGGEGGKGKYCIPADVASAL